VYFTQARLTLKYLSVMEYRSEVGDWRKYIKKSTVAHEEYKSPTAVGTSEACGEYISTWSTGKCCYRGWWQLFLIEMGPNSCTIENSVKNCWADAG
jgi:hypothetical protein